MMYTTKSGFPYYYNLAKDRDLKSLFTSSSIVDFLKGISEEKATYRYAQEKWSIKQIVGHITDHERIKIYRAFLLSRNQEVQLWGYDQNTLVKNSRFDELTYKYLVNEFVNVRKASISFIEGLSKNQLKLKGVANEFEITLEDFLKSIIGHEIHHTNILKNKYL